MHCMSMVYCSVPSSRDHSGGNEVLKKEFRDLAVYGGARDSVAGATQ